MFAVESYAAVRRFVFVDGHSRRQAASVFGLSRDTVGKMCPYSAPPGYRRTKPPTKPKLGTLLPVIDPILDADRGGKRRSSSNTRLGDRRTAWEFLEHLLKAVLYHIHTILSDNGIQFAEQHRLVA